MKAEELQINDWVLIHGYPKKIKSISEDSVGYYPPCDPTRMFWASLDDIQPIPITPEFLDKNIGRISEGFWLSSISTKELIIDIECTQINNGYRILIVVDEEGKRPSRFVGDIYYVHELQHASFSCKLDKGIVI